MSCFMKGSVIVCNHARPVGSAVKQSNDRLLHSRISKAIGTNFELLEHWVAVAIVNFKCGVGNLWGLDL